MEFLLVFIAFFVKYLRKLTALTSIDKELSLYFRTSGFTPSKNIITCSEEVDNFEAHMGKRHVTFLSDGRVATPEIGIANKIKKLVEKAEVLGLVVDGNDFLHLHLSTKEKLSYLSLIDLDQFLANGGNEHRAHIDEIVLTDSDSWLSLTGLKVGKIIVNGKFHGRLWLHDCWIKQLKLESSSNDYSFPSVSLTDTWVNNLELSPGSCHDFEVIGGGIGQFSKISHSEIRNIFSGNVNFRRNPQLHWTGTGLLPDNQSYRDVVAEIHKQGNIDSEKYLLAFLRRMERPQQLPLIRFCSYVYDAVSFYGNLPERAFMNLVFLILFGAVLVFISDSALFTQNCNNIESWASFLCGESLKSDLWRALYLSLESIIKPLSIINSTSLMTTTSPLVMIWLTLQSLLSVSIIAVIIVGIRRKFIAQ